VTQTEIDVQGAREKIRVSVDAVGSHVGKKVKESVEKGERGRERERERKGDGDREKRG
jgi:hypothetical protein